MLTMAAARLLAWGLLLAGSVLAGAREMLPMRLPSNGTLQRGRDPRHNPARGQRWPRPSPTWEASGDPSGAGVLGSEQWRGSSPVRWSLPLHLGDATGLPLETETTVVGTRAWQDPDTAQAMAEKPLITWQGHEAGDQDSPWGTTWMLHSSASGRPDSKGPTNTELGSSGPPWAGQGPSLSEQSATKPASTPSPQATVSTIVLTPKTAAGTETGTADVHVGEQPAGGTPTIAPGLLQKILLTPASSKVIPLGTVPISHHTGTETAKGPYTSPSSEQPAGRLGNLEGPPSPSLALPSAAPQLPSAAPSWGLAEPWTRVVPAHQRSTRRAPLSHATARPGYTAPHTDPGMTGQQGPQPAPETALSTSQAPLPASSMDLLGTPGTGRTQHGMRDPLVWTEPR